MTLTREAFERMEQWLARQKRRRAHRRRRELSEYGLDARDVMARFDLYVQTFDVAKEQSLARCAA